MSSCSLGNKTGIRVEGHGEEEVTSFSRGFLSISNIDILGWMILCCGGLSCALQNG